MTREHKYEIADELPAQNGMRRTSPIDWDSAKQAMIDHTGKWVKLAENVSASTLQQLRKGRNVRFRGDDLKCFEFAARRPKGADYRKNFTDLWGKHNA